jgi:DNA-binding FrmR family transcriptional regulator
MVEDDAYCLDFLAQVSAATRRLQAFSPELLNEQLAHRVLDAACAGGHPAEQRLTDATEAIACLVPS